MCLLGVCCQKKSTVFRGNSVWEAEMERIGGRESEATPFLSPSSRETDEMLMVRMMVATLTRPTAACTLCQETVVERGKIGKLEIWRSRVVALHAHTRCRNEMTCHVASCHAVSTQVMSRHVMSCDVKSCHLVACHDVLSSHVTSCPMMTWQIACDCLMSHQVTS